MLGQVRDELGIPEDEEEDLQEFSPQNTTFSTESSKLRYSPMAKYDRFNQTRGSQFGSTMDSQNTYNFKDTSSGDMFSTIHSEREELSATQALQDYQMGITRHEEEEKSYESPGEIKPDTDEEDQMSRKSGNVRKQQASDEVDRRSVKSAKSEQSKMSESKASMKSQKTDMSGKSGAKVRKAASVRDDDVTGG